MTPAELAAYEAEERAEAQGYLDTLHTLTDAQLCALARKFIGRGVHPGEDAEQLVREHFEACQAETLRPGDMAISLPFCACGRRLHECDGSRAGCCAAQRMAEGAV